MNTPKIIAKSFPNKDQIQGRIDSKAFDGIELFVMDNILESPEQYQETIKFARDNFPIVNFETFYGVKINGVTKATSVIDLRDEVREKSRALLEAAVKLNQRKGTVNTHFASIPIYLDEPSHQKIPSTSEQIEMFGSYLSQFKNEKVITENVIAYDAETPEQRPAVYHAGLDISDFVRLYEKYRVPMNLDTAHLGICLQQYAYAVQGQEFKLPSGQKIIPQFTEHQRNLGKQVLEKGLMPVWMEQVKQLPIGAIGSMHFINSRAGADGSYNDGYVELSEGDGKLLDLDRALKYFQSRGDITQIVPEVVDGLYSKTPDYNAAPKMAEMARILRAKLR